MTVCVSPQSSIISFLFPLDVVWTKTDKSIEIYYTGYHKQYNYLITAAIFSLCWSVIWHLATFVRVIMTAASTRGKADTLLFSKLWPFSLDVNFLDQS